MFWREEKGRLRPEVFCLRQITSVAESPRIKMQLVELFFKLLDSFDRPFRGKGLRKNHSTVEIVIQPQTNEHKIKILVHVEYPSFAVIYTFHSLYLNKERGELERFHYRELVLNWVSIPFSNWHFPVKTLLWFLHYKRKHNVSYNFKLNLKSWLLSDIVLTSFCTV